MLKKRPTRVVNVGSLKIGGGNPIRVQTMTKTKTHDVKATVKQIHELEEKGAELIRVAVPDLETAKRLGEIKSKIHIPLIADIHFNPQLALEAINQGVDKIRINPGNIIQKSKIKTRAAGKAFGDARQNSKIFENPNDSLFESVRKIIRKAKERSVAIRIGVNAGSLEEDLLGKYHGVTPQGLVESVIRWIKLFENLDFEDIIVSLKTADALRTIQAYRLFSQKSTYPLHLGVTEAGPIPEGIIQSAVGIGTLLAEGIGDTIRVSLSAEPHEEVMVGWEILKTLRLRQRGPIIISCPTCGRTEVDLFDLIKKIKPLLDKVKKPIKVAIMGCVVNGPGEAREADIGIAGGRKMAAIFVKGKIVKTVQEKELFNEFKKYLEKILRTSGSAG